MSSCMFLSNLVFKSYTIVIRIGDTTFLATWDDTGDVGVVNLTIAELQEFTTNIGSDKGEHITSILNIIFIDIVHTVRSQTRNVNGNVRQSIQIETEV